MVRLDDYLLAARFDLDDASPCFVAFDASRHPVWLRRAHAGCDEAFEQGFEERTRAARSHRFTGVCRLRDAGFAQGRPFAVYAPDFGVALTRLLARFPMSPRAWARMGLDLLDGMEALHRAGLRSGWLLPDRVLCTFDHRFMWMDPTLGPFSLIPSPTALRARFYDDPSAAPSIEADQRALIRVLQSARPSELSVVRLEPQGLRSTLLELAQDTTLEVTTTRDRFRRLYTRLQSTLRHPEAEGPGRGRGGDGPVAGTRPVDFEGFVAVAPRLLRGSAREGWIKLCASPAAATKEAQALRDWRSAWTLQLRSVCADASTPHLHLDGPAARTLAAWLNAEQPPQEARLAWCADAARALRELHEHDVMLGAVHAKGVGVVPGGGCILLDTTHLGPAHMDAVRDSPLVLAPEVYGARPRYDLASERFAFGMLVYELLAGTRPFRGLQPEALQSALQSKAPTPLRRMTPEVPASISALIDGLLSRSPSERPGWQEVDQVLASA